MKKDTFYFSHDYNTRNDVKIKKLLYKHNLLGYGVFWAIIEDLYQNDNSLPLDYESMSFDLRVDGDIIKSIINDFDLFVIDGNSFGSLSVEVRLNERKEKSKNAKKAADYRWFNIKNKNADALQTHTETDADALQPQCTSNAIKESKVKEKKVKEKKVKEKKGNEKKKNNIAVLENEKNTSNSLLEDKTIIPPKKITPKLFNDFWELYPKKIDKGKCLTLWTKICTRQDNVPTWSEIKKAIHYQKQSERWKDVKFIPHPSTWLNQCRWLDDPAEMKTVKFDYDKPKPKTTFGHLDAITPNYEDDDSY